MKTTLISIAILIVLIVFFSTIPYEVTLREYSPAEIENPFGNWAFPGNSGDPILGEGGSGTLNVFAIGGSNESGEMASASTSSQVGGTVYSQTSGLIQFAPTEAQAGADVSDYNPISVEVVEEKRTKSSSNLEPINQVLCWIANVVIAINIMVNVILLVQHIIINKNKKPSYDGKVY